MSQLPPPEYHEVVSEQDEKPHFLNDENPKASHDDTASNASEESAAINRTGNKSFFIDAKGFNCCAFRFDSTDLTTHITNPDGSPAYESTRHSRCSGSCVLTHSKHGDIISTQYQFGPGRPPKLAYCQASSSPPAQVVIEGQICSRTKHFTAPNGRTFEWRYAKDKATRSNLLELRERRSDVGKGTRGPALATLVRNDATRPEGTNRWTAGNGGELVIGSDAAQLIDEPLVIATCLVMLKREVDRNRSAVIGGTVVVAS